LSDRLGRRRVIALGLGVAAAALALFVAARGTGWLFAARAVQGLAVGIITGTAGPVLAGVLAQWAPGPRLLCYLIGLAASGALAVAVLRIPEPHPPGGQWRLQLPSVPAWPCSARSRP
jgi:MFS family permease